MMFERYLKLIFGVDNIKIRSNYIIGCDEKSCIAKGFLVVREITRSLEDLHDGELTGFLNSFVRILSKPFPIEIRTVFIPIDKEKFLNKLNIAIQTKEIVRESDPTNERLATELERLRRLKKKILEGDTPYNVAMIIIVSAEGSNEEDARERLIQRMKILTQDLKDLGVVVEEVRGVFILEVLNRFFRI